MVTVEVRTLAGPKHSGQFGGEAPDALLALLHALGTLHDEHGDVAVAGLQRDEWTGASYSDDEFRELAEVEEGIPFFGTGGLGERIWAGPAVTVTGMDVLPVDGAVNAVVPYARAEVSLRVHPEQDPAEAQAARAALASAWGGETVSIASGGSTQVLFWFGLKATFEVVKTPPVPTEETYSGGSVEPTDVGPTQAAPPGSYHVVTETAKVKGLLQGAGVRYLFTSLASNFRSFAAVAIILVVMVGVGLAEAVGLIAALRKLVGVSSKSTLTFIIICSGSSRASPPTPATSC